MVPPKIKRCLPIVAAVETTVVQAHSASAGLSVVTVMLESG